MIFIDRNTLDFRERQKARNETRKLLVSITHFLFAQLKHHAQCKNQVAKDLNNKAWLNTLKSMIFAKCNTKLTVQNGIKSPKMILSFPRKFLFP